MNLFIIQLCKHDVAKVTLVPCSVKLTGKRVKVGHGEVTINNPRIIYNVFSKSINIYSVYKTSRSCGVLMSKLIT